MADPDDIVRLVAEGERLVTFGDFSRALDMLQTAATKLPKDHPDAPGLIARINEALTAIVRARPRFGDAAQAVRDITMRRGSSVASGAPSSSPSPDRRYPYGAANFASEPWFYRAGEAVTQIAIIAAVLSVIGGIFIGLETSTYRDFGGSTHQRGGVIAYWVVIGVLSGVLWLALAVIVNLLADIGRSLRGSRRE